MERQIYFILPLKILIVWSVVAFSAEIDIEQLKSQIPDGILPSELLNATISIDDIKRVFEAKCNKVSGDEIAFNEVEKGTTTLMECVTNLFNVSAIQLEIEAARPKGQMDEVFHKYCLKQPELIECMSIYKSKLEPCFDEKEVTHSEGFMKIFKKMLGFICDSGGDQIALFIAEKGLQCFDQKRDDIINCLNRTFIEYIPKEGGISLDSLPPFVMGPKQCGDVDILQECIVTSLEHCKDITPSNLVDSMFKYVRTETVCEKSVSSANSAINFSLGLLIIMLGLLYV